MERGGLRVIGFRGLWFAQVLGAFWKGGNREAATYFRRLPGELR